MDERTLDINTRLNQPIANILSAALFHSEKDDIVHAFYVMYHSFYFFSIHLRAAICPTSRRVLDICQVLSREMEQSIKRLVIVVKNLDKNL